MTIGDGRSGGAVRGRVVVVAIAQDFDIWFKLEAVEAAFGDSGPGTVHSVARRRR